MLDLLPSATTLGSDHALLPSLMVMNAAGRATVGVKAPMNASSGAKTEC